MPYSRHVDDNGILITKLSGVVTYAELKEALDAMNDYVQNGEVYELLSHLDVVKLDLSSEESRSSANNLIDALKNIKKAAIAFVANNDFIYGINRQLQIRVENDFIQLSVFRTEETALKWLNEMKSFSNQYSEDK